MLPESPSTGIEDDACGDNPHTLRTGSAYHVLQGHTKREYCAACTTAMGVSYSSNG